MPNVMAALPKTGGTLCESSVIPFLVPRRKLWLTPTTRVPCSNAANIGERKTWTLSEFCSWQNSVRSKILQNVYMHCESKKGATLAMAITLSFLGGFAKFSHCCKEQWIFNKTNHTLSMLLHYLGKLKYQKFAIHMHAKHVSNVTFLSSI